MWMALFTFSADEQFLLSRVCQVVSSILLGFSARAALPTKLNYGVFSHYPVDLGSEIAPMKTRASSRYSVVGWVAISSVIAVAAYFLDVILFSSSTIISPFRSFVR